MANSKTPRCPTPRRGEDSQSLATSEPTAPTHNHVTIRHHARKPRLPTPASNTNIHTQPQRQPMSLTSPHKAHNTQFNDASLVTIRRRAHTSHIQQLHCHGVPGVHGFTDEGRAGRRAPLPSFFFFFARLCFYLDLGTDNFVQSPSLSGIYLAAASGHAGGSEPRHDGAHKPGPSIG